MEPSATTTETPLESGASHTNHSIFNLLTVRKMDGFFFLTTRPDRAILICIGGYYVTYKTTCSET